MLMQQNLLIPDIWTQLQNETHREIESKINWNHAGLNLINNVIIKVFLPY